MPRYRIKGLVTWPVEYDCQADTKDAAQARFELVCEHNIFLAGQFRFGEVDEITIEEIETAPARRTGKGVKKWPKGSPKR